MSERYPEGFSWSVSTKRYRNKATGRFLKNTTVQKVRDDFIEQNYGIVQDLTTSLARGERLLRTWESEVWNRINITFTAEYLAGRGGKNAITSADRKIIGSMLKDQRQFLRDFTQTIANDGMSEAMIQSRIKLYLNSSRQAFERGKSQAYGLKLPAYPADGSSECGANDRCHWEISEKSDRIDAYWRLSVAEHCGTCLDRGTRWNPYTVRKD